MNPTELRALQTAILASQDCAPHIITNDAPKVPADEARQRDEAVADIMTAAGFGSGSQQVPAWRLKRLLIMRGRWRGIVLAAQDANHPAVEAAYAAVALAEDANMTADLLDPTAGPMLAGLVATSLISEADRAELEEMCTVPGRVTAADVSRALRGPWGDE